MSNGGVESSTSASRVAPPHRADVHRGSVPGIPEQRDEEGLRGCLEADEALTRISALLASPGSPDLSRVLSIVGEKVDASRARIVLTRDGEGILDAGHREWCAPGIPPAPGGASDLAADAFPWWTSRLRRGATLCMEDLSTLPPEAAEERRVLEERGVRSALLVPLQPRGGGLLGFIVLEDTRARRSWHDDDVRGLRLAAGMVAADLERRRTEDALRWSEDHFRALIEDAPNLIMVLASDGTARYLSPGYRDALGYEPTSLVGRPVLDFVHPEDRRSVAEDVAGLARTPGATADLEARVRHRDGSWRRLAATVKNLLDAPGVRGVVVNALDVTERRAAEDRIRLLSRAVESSPASIVITDPLGRVVYTNPKFSETTGYSAAEALGRRPPFLQSGRSDPGIHRELRRTITGGGEWHGELECRRKDGSALHEIVSISPVRTDGTITHFVAVEEDVTERRLFQARLEQAQRMQMVGRLAGGVAHDINNVLTAIGGYARFILEALPDGDPLRADVEEIGRANERAAGVVGQLLAFSRRDVVETTLLDLNEVARGIERMLERLIGEDVELSVSLGEHPATVRADRTRMEQVLVNLAVNARDSMPGGGTISIAVEGVQVAGGGDENDIPPGDYVRLAVQDTGAGIPPEIRPHLFEPFFTTKPAGKGAGLGLATVHSIVKDSGGHIGFDSIPGQGTVFRIHLPAAHGEPSPALPAALEDVEGGDEVILLVEDDLAVRSVSQRVLHAAGYEVLVAADGLEALRVAERHDGRIDLLLTDAVMPELGGAELVRRLRVDRPDAGVLFISGYALEEVEGEAINPLEHAFLKKPFGPTGLLRKVRELLDGAARRRPGPVEGTSEPGERARPGPDHPD